MSECPSTPEMYEPDEGPLLRIGISWAGLLEPVEVSPFTEMQELAYYIESANDCIIPGHKLFIYKGMLLPDDMSLEEAGVRDGAVLHLVLDDCPYQGRPLYVNCQGQTIKTIVCGADFYIEDVKEDLSYFIDQPPPERQSLLFAGRELQSYHTLREYNIQKESVLFSVSRQSGRELQNFIDGVCPERDSCIAPENSVVQVRLCPESKNKSHFWGCMLGGPDTDTIDSSVFTVRACTETGWSRVQGIIQIRGHVVSFVPSQPLLPATRYDVALRGSNQAHTSSQVHGRDRTRDDDDQRTTLMHTKVREKVHGEYSWSFCTVGYEPLRILAIYPRPYSRVRGSTAVVVVRFSRSLTPRDRRGAADWVTVRGHALLPPAYDPDACALVYPFADGAAPQPGEICRAHINADRVRGARGESLYPVQPDGLLRTSTFRWKFYADGPSKSTYERLNLAASGVGAVLARHASGRLAPLGRGSAAAGPAAAAQSLPASGEGCVGCREGRGGRGGSGGGNARDAGGGARGGSGSEGHAKGWGIGMPSLRALLCRPDPTAEAQAAAAAAAAADGRTAAVQLGYASWLNPSALLADAVDALYGEEPPVLQ